MVRPTPAIEAIPATTPFVGPEQLMRERGLSELVRLGANESPFGPSPQRDRRNGNPSCRATGVVRRSRVAGLRDALAAKHACDPEQIVDRLGHRRRDGLSGSRVRVARDRRR